MDGGTPITSTTIEALGPSGLRELASLLEKQDPELRARRELPPEAIEELAAMLAAGETPTIGWWRRWRKIRGDS